MIANAGRENAPSLPSTFVPTPSRPVIEPVPESAPTAAAAEGEPEAGAFERNRQERGQS